MIEVTYNAPSAQKANGYAHSGPNLARYLREEGIELVADGQPRKVGLSYGYPRMLKALKTEAKICFTMFESDVMPEDWKDDLKEADEIVVPSFFCRDTMRKLGFESQVIPLGIEHDLWPFIERPKRDVFTFLCYESFNVRKGFFELFKAFTDEFKPEEPVRLILKTVRQDNVIPMHEYPNIKPVKGEFSRFELLTLLHEADAFVFPSRGEGFGHTPLEAIATGLPAIAPNAHGIATYYDPRFISSFDFSKVPAKYDHVKGETGDCIKADPASLGKTMRYVVDTFGTDHEKWADLRRAGHDWVMDKWTYRAHIKKLADLIKQYAS